ncbi:hypothetical protein DRO19_00090 [Candidatus Bathyarchaeota archaeon]|nr:MAG: hypothetical protein DRO19_00090 [Candidatus Bathyarchaeota archaeon]
MKAMPIIRKIIQVGTSKAIVLPKGWLDWIQRMTGSPPKEVLMTIKDETIIVEPILKPEVVNEGNKKRLESHA